MTPPIDPLIVTAADALKSVQDLAAQVARLRQELNAAYDALGSHNRSDLTGQITRLRKALETAQKEDRDSFAEVERLKEKIASLELGGSKADLQIQRFAHEVEKLRRENETLARQVPSEPSYDHSWAVVSHGESSEPSSATSKNSWSAEIPVSDLEPEDLRVPNAGSQTISAPGAFRQHLNQQWCLTIDLSLLPRDDIRIVVGPGMWAVLCNVYRDPATGALTYEPVPINDLPKIP